MKATHRDRAPAPSGEEYLRLPGLFRRWELEQVLEADTDFRLEEAGTASDGTPLLAVYQRLQPQTAPKQESEQ